MKPIDIVAVTFNRIAFTRQFYRHLVDRTRTPFRLIVVDNGSTDGTVEFLQECKRVDSLVLFDNNRGIHCAKNAGLKLVQSRPYYVDTDNDILCPDLEPDWIARLVDLMDRYSDYGAIACRPQAMVGSPGDFWDGCGEIKDASRAGASLRIMRTEQVKQVGGWRNVVKPGRNNEEQWIADKFRQIGFRVGYASQLYCWHCFCENWGYKDIPMEVHGHRPIWPLPSTYDQIKCDAKTWEPL